MREGIQRTAQKVGEEGVEVALAAVCGDRKEIIGEVADLIYHVLVLLRHQDLGQAEPYSHQKGIFPAREAVVMQQQERGLSDISVNDVFIGNGVSELIDLSMRALLSPGDEVLVPSPDYPLWSATVTLNGGKAVHYPAHQSVIFNPIWQQWKH